MVHENWCFPVLSEAFALHSLTPAGGSVISVEWLYSSALPSLYSEYSDVYFKEWK